MSGRLRIGTSSWSDKSWVGVFYPEKTRPGDMLVHYAERFDTVEADVTYYRVPSRKMVEGWERKLPAGFKLCSKFPRSIVHAGKGASPDPERLLMPDAGREDALAYLDNMRLLGEKCGPLVLQFPYFNRQAFASAAPFLERLDAFLGWLPGDLRYAVEVRNKAWIDADLLDLLRAHGVALTLVDLAYMPHPAELAEGLDLLTADFVYARLIGDRKRIDALTSSMDRVVIDQSQRLQAWSGLLQQLLQRVPEAYVYANNHYAGHGPATAQELRDLVLPPAG